MAKELSILFISIGAAILSLRVRFVALAVLVAAPWALFPQECLAKCVSRGSGESADPAAVSRINEGGFADLRKAGADGDIIISPVSSWYVRELVASGESASRTLSAHTRSVTLSLRHEGYDINTALWTKREVKIPSAALDEIRGGLCGDVFAVDSKRSENARGANAERTSIAKWVHAAAAPDASAVQTAYSASAATGATKHALIGLNVVSMNADFTSQLSRIGFRDLRYYRDGSLWGIRLDATDGHTSLYIMVSDRERLEAFWQDLNVSAWRIVRTQFVKASVDIADVGWNRQYVGNFDAGAATLFGSVLSGGGFFQQSSTFSLDNGMLHVASISSLLSVDGMPVPRASPVNEYAPYPQAFLRLMEPRFVVLEDRNTGAILLMGWHL